MVCTWPPRFKVTQAAGTSADCGQAAGWRAALPQLTKLMLPVTVKTPGASAPELLTARSGVVTSANGPLMFMFSPAIVLLPTRVRGGRPNS